MTRDETPSQRRSGSPADPEPAVDATDGHGAAAPDTVGPSTHAADRADVDVAVVDALARDLDDEATVVALVSTFLGELDPRVATLARAVADGDHTTARRVSHTLKSSARLLGAERLGDACAEIEAGALDGVADLPALADRARVRLVRWLAAHERGSTESEA